MTDSGDGPRSDGDDRPPPRLMGPGFWIALALGLICVLAGLALATFGPRWL